MPTNIEVQEKFYDYYSLKLDDYLDKIIKDSDRNGINMLNNNSKTIFGDFSDLILSNCNLKKSFLSKEGK